MAEVDGFRGLKWGTELSVVESEMTYIRTDPSFGGIKYYRKLGDELKIGGAELENIEYGFWRDRLCCVLIDFRDELNFMALRDAAMEKFGRSSQPNKYIDKHFWVNDPVGYIMISYSKISRKGVMHMASRKIVGEQESFNKSRARSGAETGF
jgi:hypothetical protein